MKADELLRILIDEYNQRAETPIVRPDSDEWDAPAVHGRVRLVDRLTGVDPGVDYRTHYYRAMEIITEVGDAIPGDVEDRTIPSQVRELVRRARKTPIEEFFASLQKAIAPIADALRDAHPDLLAIANDVLQECQRQDEKWGGPEHDDQHTDREWTAIVAEHLGRAGYAISEDDAVGYRRQMVRVAALAVAALEAFDRRAR